MNSKNDLERFLLDIAIKSSEILIKMQDSAKIKQKSWHDLVTQADVESQKLIVEKIKSKYPTHTIFAEEGMQDSDLYSENCWIIDPLDGTNNYAYGIPLWGVCVAYAKKGKLQASVIAYPNQKIILTAQMGFGAFEYRYDGEKLSEPKKIYVSKKENIKQAMVLVCPAPHSVDASKNFEKIAKFSNKVFSLRQLGSAIFEIGYVAMGIAQICILFRLKPHDGAAGALIVREAGGVVTDLKGEEWKLDSESFVATNGITHKEILELMGD